MQRSLGASPSPPLERTTLFHDGSGAIEYVLPTFSVATAVLTVSAICQKKNDSAVGQPADPQWTRCRRGPTAFPGPIARWQNLPRDDASPQLPASLILRPSSEARPRNQSVPCSTAIGNLPSPIQKTRAWALRLQPLYPEFQALGLSQAWVLRA